MFCTACEGGALTLDVPEIFIGGGAPPDASATVMTPDFFTKGFSSYTIIGQNGVTVANGTSIGVVQPIEQFTAATALDPSGTDPVGAFAVGLPALYTPNTATAVMVQRPGAGLTLQAGTTTNLTAGLTIGAGSIITVDPLQSIALNAPGQITIDGSLIAPSGTISAWNDQYRYAGSYASLSIWLGGDSVVDVSARAVTAADWSGRIFGTVPDGGTIEIGSQGNTDNQGYRLSTDAFIVVQPGAVLSAAGTSAMLDLTAGQDFTARVPARSGAGQTVQVSSNGGSMSFDSESGIYLGGRMTAPAGGAGAQGGTLSVNLVTPPYTDFEHLHDQRGR